MCNIPSQRGIARLTNDDAFFAYVMIKTCFHYFNLVSGFLVLVASLVYKLKWEIFLLMERSSEGSSVIRNFFNKDNSKIVKKATSPLVTWHPLCKKNVCISVAAHIIKLKDFAEV